MNGISSFHGESLTAQEVDETIVTLLEAPPLASGFHPAQQALAGLRGHSPIVR